MDNAFLYVPDIAREVTVPDDGIISRTIHNDDHLKVVMFGFDKGQELSEHTASVPAVIHILDGEAELSFGGEKRDAGPGAWAWMAANLPHTVVAKSKVTMLLLMLKSAK